MAATCIQAPAEEEKGQSDDSEGLGTGDTSRLSSIMSVHQSRGLDLN